jgi:hypothetical protein
LEERKTSRPQSRYRWKEEEEEEEEEEERKGLIAAA